MLNRIDLSRADLNLLVLFEIVHDERHVGRAAEKLNLTPSAVSHGLGRLRRLLNDPLFLRTPKGVVPTARAMELASPIADVLARVRSVISTAEPFDPANSTRRFTIGAPDGVAAVFLPPLLAELGRTAPGIDIGVRQLLPAAGETSPERAWRSAFADLEAGAMDIAVIPSGHIPTRFHARSLYNEDFVLVMQVGHPFADDPTLERYCEMKHLVVSFTGDPHGFVDEVLATQGYSRRIALTVPSFMFALAVLADTDLISALPKRFVAMHAARFGVVSLEAPLPLTTFQLNAVAPRAAMMDAGLAWIFDLLAPRHERWG
ncbi:MAG: LysR family transcriptional regulator [Mesorhizobium sp.]|uniref:LysR family transcriptional regulator n=1 Tax=Mesorhizobium sp. TaxID=1871066 RepID=UPI000FE92027|nr:LysR family transcriptional regulator [Mesorhizobium sp.]RWH82891.1 MAG: LysR family transcriptional regulator [Mesorhizobium sp.]RWH87188.1 MAG: LysR family transcriptional regulator [Mesorhizobium sp.]RWH93269.1 MAG: LysR family transcriptional regulator [Mesorhizobium sp.]RWH98862.1 MAG: LysR family transcriptional regulator [Mesorhizobium sp.]RWI02590.1 MAG: LysR family transcriptional regulator [Mesorhizobium sp.]